MAKNNYTRVVGLRPGSFAMFAGTFWGVIGLGVAILHSLRNTVEYTQETQSVLAGLAFGVATGIVAILVLPFLYFAIGWVIGYLQGWVFNVIAEQSGGIDFKVSDNK